MSELVRKMLHTVLLAEKDDADGGGGDDKGADDKGADRGDDHQDDKTDAGTKAADDKSDDKSDDDSDKSDKRKQITIPKWRADEMIKKERARAQAAEDARARAEDELAKQRKGADDQITVLNAQIDKLDEEYETLLADGKTKEAVVVRKKLRATQDELIDVKTERKLLTSSASTKSEIEYTLMLNEIEELFPQLDPKEDDFDQDLAQDMADFVRGKVSQGQSPAAALRRAISRFIGEDATAQADEAREERTREARRRAAEAAKRQPASLRDVGEDHDKKGMSRDGKAKTIIQMSQDEFAKVSEEELAKLRGDIA